MRRADERGAGDVGGARGIPQPRLRPGDLRGPRKGAGPEGLPRLRRRRPTGVAGERDPAGPPSHDRSEGPPRGSRPAPQHTESGARCPMCGAAWLADATRCASCGSTFGLELDPVAIEARLEQITGDLVNLAADEDFQGMPEDVRNEILQAFGGVTRHDLLREEYSHPVDAWRTKGFDVGRVEPLLDEDLATFREQSAPLIRLQVAT